MMSMKSVIALSLVLIGCGDSTLADCDKLDVNAEVIVQESSPPEFSWEGGPIDEIVVARTGDGVEVWNIYVDMDNADQLNQMPSPITYGVWPDVDEGVTLVEVVESEDLEVGVEYQVQVIMQCQDGSVSNVIGSWMTEVD